MTIAFKLKDRSGAEEIFRFNRFPDKCPRCHRSIDVSPRHGSQVRREFAQILFRCSAIECDEVFIATYWFESRASEFQLRRVDPKTSVQAKFPDTVKAISPAFVQIFDQAIAAEAQGLDQLVGIGLRKSLEFLIKDFAISLHPDSSEKIRALMLSPCITEYISDANIKECAKRAAWLGNDEAHYTRKWDERDIEDLKLLVHLTTNWIDNSILTARYIEQMSPGGR